MERLLKPMWCQKEYNDVNYIKAWEKQRLNDLKPLIAHLDEIQELNKNQYCAYFYNGTFGDRGDPYCSKIKEIEFEKFSHKKNIWLATTPPTNSLITIVEINKHYYNFEDLKMLKEKYNLKTIS